MPGLGRSHAHGAAKPVHSTGLLLGANYEQNATMWSPTEGHMPAGMHALQQKKLR